MGASQFVGRVGGLAVALGVGAAVFAGAGVAWADAAEGQGDAGPSASASSGDSGGASSTGRGHRGASGAAADSDPGSAGASAADDDPAPPADPTPTARESTGDDSPLTAPEEEAVKPGANLGKPEVVIDPEVAEDPEPSVIEPEIVEPMIVEPEVIKPEVIEPEPVDGPEWMTIYPVGEPEWALVDPTPEWWTLTDPVVADPEEPVAAPAVEELFGSVSDPADSSDAATDSTIPLDSAIEWAALAYVRRDEPGAAGDETVPAVLTTTSEAAGPPEATTTSAEADPPEATTTSAEADPPEVIDAPLVISPAPATTGPVTNNGVTVDPQLSFFDGVVQGNLNASSASGTELTTKFVGSSAGGKMVFGNVPASQPDGGASSFTLLPYATWIDPASPTQNPTPSGAQTFTVRVSENTDFNKFVADIPLVGMIAQPIIELLQQTPFVSGLLAPIIGGSVTAEIPVDMGTIVPAGKSVAFTYMVTSFDGTQISTNFFPATESSLLADNFQATVFSGPGLGSPGATDPYGLLQALGSTPGVGVLRGNNLPPNLGFNVITWDPRGEGASGGILELDNPFFEGRDVSALIDWASANTPMRFIGGAPAIGMAGGSYGGGIQMTTVDPRIKAIVPAIAWNSLNVSLYPDEVFKTGWVNSLYQTLVQAGARVNQQIPMAVFTGNLFGFISDTAQAVLASSGPTALLTKLNAPAMFVQGIVDGLFPLSEASVNAQTMLGQNPYFDGANANQIKMAWFCGGHGVCLDPVDLVAQSLAIFTDNMLFLNRYVKESPLPIDVLVPKFQWWDQTGARYKSGLMPFAGGFVTGAVSATADGGNLGILPFAWLGSGPNTTACGIPSACQFPLNNTFATKAPNALNVPITVPVAGTQIVGAPTVSFSYSGWGTAKAVYGQIIDDATGRVLGNLVTPIPVTLDGETRSLSVPIADIVYTAPQANAKLTLQITGGATVYQNGSIGGLNISDIKVDLPTTTAGTKV